MSPSAFVLAIRTGADRPSVAFAQCAGRDQARLGEALAAGKALCPSRGTVSAAGTRSNVGPGPTPPPGPVPAASASRYTCPALWIGIVIGAVRAAMRREAGAVACARRPGPPPRGPRRRGR